MYDALEKCSAHTTLVNDYSPQYMCMHVCAYTHPLPPHTHTTHPKPHLSMSVYNLCKQILMNDYNPMDTVLVQVGETIREAL